MLGSSPSGAALGLYLSGGAVVGILLLHFIWVAGRRLIMGPETLFLAMAAGTFACTTYYSMHEGSAAGVVYSTFVGLGILCFGLGTIVATILLSFDHRAELAAFRSRRWCDDLMGIRRSYALAVGFIASAVTVVYFYQVGAFVPLAALRALLTEGANEMTLQYNELRAATTPVTGAYLAPGYVSQFRNVLLPLVCILFLMQNRIGSAHRNRGWIAFFAIMATAATVGTGARFGLAMFGALFLLFGIAPHVWPANLRAGQIMAVGLVLFISLTGLTLMMGPRGQAAFDSVVWAPYQVLARVFASPSLERLQVFERFLAFQPPQLGMNTVNALSTVLPGPSEYTLPNQLHELLYDSPFGDVGLDVWGTLWYDWQWGGPLIAFALGMVYHAFYVGILRGRKTVIRITALTFAGFVLGLATDLQVLLLRGFPVLVLFWIGAEVLGSVPRGGDLRARPALDVTRSGTVAARASD